MSIKRISILLVVMILMSGCSLLGGSKTSTKPVDRPKLDLPKAEAVKMRPVSFVVLTPENVDTIFKKLDEAKKELVLFGVDGQSYKNLSLNLEILKQYMIYQNQVIRLYKEYYGENTQQN